MKQKLQLELIKKLLKKEGAEGFSLIELVVVVAVLAVLSAIALPSFTCFPKRAKATAALAALRQINTECAYKAADKEPEIFTSSPLDGYTIQTSGTNSCSGAQGTGVISAVPTNANELPTFNLAAATGSLTYAFRGQTGTDFTQCLGMICGNNSSSSTSAAVVEFESKFNQAIANDLTLEDKYYKRGDSIYAIVKGDTWEEAQENAKKLGGNLATINDKEENDWLAKELYGNGKASSKLTDRLALPSEPLRGTGIWLGNRDLNGTGKYESVSGEEDVYINWGPGELADGIGKGEKYSMFTLHDTYNRDPGMVGTVPNRQYNTPGIRARGGAHIFYGLAEIKINENLDVDEKQLKD